MVDERHPPLPPDLEPRWDHERGVEGVHPSGKWRPPGRWPFLAMRDGSGGRGSLGLDGFPLGTVRLLAGSQACMWTAGRELSRIQKEK